MIKSKIFKSIKLILIFALVLICGQIGLAKNETKTLNNNLNKTLDLHAMAIKLAELKTNELYHPLDTYMGKLTGYVADCPLCNGTLGCTGQNVLDGTINYNDLEYGNVRIVASSKSLPCGSIIQFSLPTISDQNITAIVLDRGVLGTDIDLLVGSYNEAITKVGNKQISYDILRVGYKR